MNRRLFIDEDNLIEWDEMKDSSDDSYINNATGTWTLKTNVSNTPTTTIASGSIAYVTASSGKYQATIDAAAPSPALTLNATYWISVTVSSGARNGFRRDLFKAVYHGFDV